MFASFFGGDEWKLSAVIPEDYNKAVPPGLALGNETTETTVSIAIDSMDSITEKTMVLYYVTFLATVPTCCSPRILFYFLCSKTRFFVLQSFRCGMYFYLRWKDPRLVETITCNTYPISSSPLCTSEISLHFSPG